MSSNGIFFIKTTFTNALFIRDDNDFLSRCHYKLCSFYRGDSLFTISLTIKTLPLSITIKKQSSSGELRTRKRNSGKGLFQTWVLRMSAEYEYD